MTEVRKRIPDEPALSSPPPPSSLDQVELSGIVPESPPELPKLNLHQRILKITDGLGGISKTGTAPQIMGGYQFIEHAVIMAKLRTLLVEYGVVILPVLTLISHEDITVGREARPAHRVMIKLELALINAENPEEEYHIDWVGEGVDTGDKATQKAATSAEKYALMKLFKVSDREDPDAAKLEEDEGSRTSTRMPPRKPEKPSVAPAIVRVPEDIQGLAKQINAALAMKQQNDHWYPKNLLAFVAQEGIPEARKKLMDELQEALPPPDGKIVPSS
jgi:hypothetical protein